MQGDIVERGPLVEVSPHVVKRWPVQEDIAERGREIWRLRDIGQHVMENAREILSEPHVVQY